MIETPPALSNLVHSDMDRLYKQQEFLETHDFSRAVKE